MNVKHISFLLFNFNKLFSHNFDYSKLNRTGIVGETKLWDNTLMKSKQYRAEVKTRAVELLIESQKDYPSLWAAIQAIAPEQHAAQGLHTRNPTLMASKAPS